MVRIKQLSFGRILCFLSSEKLEWKPVCSGLDILLSDIEEHASDFFQVFVGYQERTDQHRDVLVPFTDCDSGSLCGYRAGKN